MLKTLLHTFVRAFERRYDYDASYLHAITEVDALGLWRFSRLTRIGGHDGGLPAEALCAARLAAAMHEDCGPCVQVVINIALEAGVPADTLAALAGGEVERATPDAALAFAFATAVLRHAPELESLRAAVVERFGPRAPWCLALALSVGRMYPVIKRATGYADSCARISVAGVEVACPAARAVPASPS